MKHSLLIKKIWEERVNQKIDSSLILFGELKSEFGLKNNQSFQEFSLSGLDKQRLNIICDGLALESSLARASRNKGLSSACLQHIERELPPATIFSSFVYQFEKAISYFSDSEWIESVHHFLKAKNLAADSLQMATCLINLILCSENLDISYQQSLEELNQLVRQLDSQVRKGIESQIHSLKLRDQWRTATLEKTEFTERDNCDINQSTYFLTYLDQIPYLAGAESSVRLENFVKKPGHLFNKDFRMRTLTGQWSEADLNSGRLTDHIDRIYLWTWKWIDNPLKFNIELLTKAIASFPWSELDHIDKMSLDNQSQFLLAVGWLSYFDNTLSGLHQTFSKKVKFAVNHKYLMAEKNTQAHLLQKSNAAPECEISIAILRIFSQFLRQNTQTANTLQTVVDLSQSTILQKNGRIIHSKSLTQAASLLLENENVAVDFLFNKTLSQLEYDQFLNAPQISNLIYKLNRILGPDILIRQKDGLVYASGNKNSVVLKYADQRMQVLKSNEDWIKIVQGLRKEFSMIVENKSKNRNKKFVIMLARYSKFSRMELQKELKISKTAACRLLQNWTTDRLICKKGFGKNTIYYFKNITKKVS